jgi:hypothetical protein
MRPVIIALALSTGLFLSAAVPAFAAPNPSGTGQPGFSCIGVAPYLNVNGFNTPGFVKATSVYAGGSSNPAGNTHAVSQYDVACFQHTH